MRHYGFCDSWITAARETGSEMPGSMFGAGVAFEFGSLCELGGPSSKTVNVVDGAVVGNVLVFARCAPDGYQPHEIAKSDGGGARNSAHAGESGNEHAAFEGDVRSVTTVRVRARNGATRPTVMPAVRSGKNC